MSDRRARAALVGLAALTLAACDGGAEVVEVSGVEIDPAYDATVFRLGAVGAELHNAPLPGLSLSDTRALVRLPGDLGEQVALPLVAPGGWARAEHGSPIRLALRFDPADDSGGDALCAAQEPLPAARAAPTEYAVQMALCLRDRALAEGRMQAGRGEPVDRAFVERTLARLLEEVLGPAGPG